MADALSPLLQQALQASAAEDTEAALHLFREACASQPLDAMPPFLLGAELAQAGQVDAAEAAYAQSVLLAPGFAIARYELGVLQFTAGRPAAALVTWHPLLAEPGLDALKLYVRGYAAWAGGGLDSAIALFEQGLAATSGNPALDGNIRIVVAALRKQLPAEAVNHVLLGAYRNSLQ